MSSIAELAMIVKSIAERVNKMDSQIEKMATVMNEYIGENNRVLEEIIKRLETGEQDK